MGNSGRPLNRADRRRLIAHTKVVEGRQTSPGQPDHVDEHPSILPLDEQHPRHKLVGFVAGFLGSAVSGLFCTLIIAALAVGGVINMALVRVFLSLAGIVAASGMVISLVFLAAPPRRKVVIGCVGILTLIGGLISLHQWIKRNGPNEADSRSELATTIVKQLAPYLKAEPSGIDTKKAPKPTEKPPTLLELFTSGDFPTLYHMDTKPDFKLATSGEKISFQSHLYLDFEANNEFIAFYVPSTPFSAALMKSLAAQVKPIIEEMVKGAEVTGGPAGEITKFRDLSFSRRVFIYHEWPITNEEKADLVQTYSAQNLAVQFRGFDYLNLRLIGWHKEHDPKP